MDADWTTKQGDSALSFDDTLTYSDGTAVNLTGATTTFVMQGLTSDVPLTLTGAVTVTDITHGGVSFQPTAADTAAAGSYMANWHVVFADTTIMTFPTNGYLWVEVQPSIAGQSGLTDSTQNVIAMAERIRPSVDALASLCRARTVEFGSGGAETGRFTAQTRPTYDEAEQLIGTAVTTVLTAVGFDMPNWTYEQARQLVLFKAAQLVELTFYALTVSKGESPYEAYKELYDEALMSLTNAIEADEGGAPHQAFYSLPIMTARQARIKSLVAASAAGDPTKLPDDMYFPMGPKGLPWNVPDNSEEWASFNWGDMNWDSWMEVSW